MPQCPNRRYSDYLPDNLGCTKNALQKSGRQGIIGMNVCVRIQESEFRIKEIGMRNRYKEIINCYCLEYLLPDHRRRRQIEIEADEQLVGFPERL